MVLKETIRRDGLRIITCAIPTQRMVLVSLSALVGSAYDPADRQGLFHYFEHMAFKGTETRTTKDIYAFTERNLLSTNASTYRDRTEYYGVAVHTKLDRACDIIAYIYARSTFPATEIKKEKGPVLLEAARNKDDDGYFAGLTLRGLLYEKNPLRQFTTGTPEGITKITRNDLLREKARWYVPSNTIALAVGRVSHDAFVKEISRRIPVDPVKAPPRTWDPEFSLPPRRAQEVVVRKDRSKSTILMGCKVPDRVNDRTDDAEDFMSSLLVSGWSSRLWNEVREARGLAYAASGGVSRTVGIGAYFNAFVQTVPGKEALVVRLMRKALFTPLTQRDRTIFEATREAVNDAITVGFGENLDAWASLIYDTIERGEPLSRVTRHFENERRIVNSLTLRDAEEMRRTLIRPERFATVIVKPEVKQ
jgi:predicted Zn-dependent peptidase